MAEFYHVFIEAKNDIKYEQVKEKMDLALDWFRCNSNVWVLYSSASIDKLQTRLKSLAEPSGSIFICRLDINKSNGWMTQDFWDWIKKNSDK